jgi:hypothetical protein
MIISFGFMWFPFSLVSSQFFIASFNKPPMKKSQYVYKSKYVLGMVRMKIKSLHATH